MSLIVRLPLNNDLTNFGCDEITTSGTPTFVQNISKMSNGSLYTNNSTLTINVPSIAGKKEYSFAFWIKRNGDQVNWGDIFSIKLSDDSLFRLETLNSSTNATIYANDRLTDSSGVVVFDTNQPFNDATWYHIAVSVSLDHICTYVNGNLRTKYKYTPTYTPKEVKSTVKIGESGIKAYINDFRIYDHPLSSTEVRKISDGMIVDYEFDEPNGNILKNTGTFTNWGLNTGCSIDNTHQLNNNDSRKVERSGLTSNEYTKLIHIVLNKSSYASISDDPCLNELVKPGDVVTCSMWMYRPSDSGIDQSTEQRIYQRSNSGGATDWSDLQETSQSIVSNKWCLLKRTYTIREDLNEAVFNVNLPRNGKFWVSSPKIEFGKDATVWTNKPSVFKDDGYFYNEAEYMTHLDPLTYHSVSGNIYKSSDTNIGFGSIVISNPNDTSSSQLTTNNFSYFNKNKTDYIGEPFSLEVVYKRTSECYDKGTFINLTGYGNKGLKFVSNNLVLYDTSTDAVISSVNRADLTSLNTWNHYVLTNDGTTIKQYLNGVLINEMASTYESLCYYYDIGYLKINDSSYRSFNGKISRLRFYTTALSADRIASLCKTSMSVDNKGNIFGTFFENDKDEKEVEKISFNKTHVIEANIDEDADVTNIKFKKTTKEILAKSFQEY